MGVLASIVRCHDMAAESSRHTILFVHNSNDLYGADVVLLNLIRGLDRKQFRAIVALPADVRHINRLSAKLEALKIPFYFLPLGIIRRRYLTVRGILRLLADLGRGIVALNSLIRRERVDIVHSNTLTVMAGPIAARLSGRPHIWHIHEIVSTQGPSRKVLHWIAAHVGGQLVTVSDAVRKHILLDQPRAGAIIKTIHNGIDLSPFLEAESGTRVRQELGIPNEALAIGTVGRVSHLKGQFLFAEAAHKVLARYPDVYFVAIGGVFDNEFHHMAALKDLVASLSIKNFKICDFREDVAAAMAAFNVFVLPSILPESFPTVIIEAMASGLPVIAAETGGVPEMVVPGKTGILFHPGEVDELESAILCLIRDEAARKAMGLAARERAVEAFRLSRFAHEFEELYGSLLSETEERPIAYAEPKITSFGKR